LRNLLEERLEKQLNNWCRSTSTSCPGGSDVDT
jgi:hypothetical protein